MKEEARVARRTKLKVELALLTAREEAAASGGPGQAPHPAVAAALAGGLAWGGHALGGARLGALVGLAGGLGAAGCLAERIGAARAARRSSEARRERVRAVQAELAELAGRDPGALPEEATGGGGAAQRAELAAEARRLAEESARVAERLEHWRLGRALARAIAWQAWAGLALGALLANTYVGAEAAGGIGLCGLAGFLWRAFGERRELGVQRGELAARRRAADAVLRGLPEERAE